MLQRPTEAQPGDRDVSRLLVYVADLELEVDRLRRHNHLVEHEVRATLGQIRKHCADATASRELAAIGAAVQQLAGVLGDMHEGEGYHPAHDQVVAIAVRPLAEQVFRWQQRLQGAQAVTLQLELESDHVEWFPARLRHILDNLLGHALKYRDRTRSDGWVRLGLRVSPQGYEFQVTDNGLSEASAQDPRFDLFYRAAPARAAGLGVGLAVVKFLVEQSGGVLTTDSRTGQGNTSVAVLPRYEIDDFLS